MLLAAGLPPRDLSTSARDLVGAPLGDGADVALLVQVVHLLGVDAGDRLDASLQLLRGGTSGGTGGEALALEVALGHQGVHLTQDEDLVQVVEVLAGEGLVLVHLRTQLHHVGRDVRAGTQLLHDVHEELLATLSRRGDVVGTQLEYFLSVGLVAPSYRC